MAGYSACVVDDCAAAGIEAAITSASDDRRSERGRAVKGYALSRSPSDALFPSDPSRGISANRRSQEYGGFSSPPTAPVHALRVISAVRQRANPVQAIQRPSERDAHALEVIDGLALAEEWALITAERRELQRCRTSDRTLGRHRGWLRPNFAAPAPRWRPENDAHQPGNPADVSSPDERRRSDDGALHRAVAHRVSTGEYPFGAVIARDGQIVAKRSIAPSERAT